MSKDKITILIFLIINLFIIIYVIFKSFFLQDLIPVRYYFTYLIVLIISLTTCVIFFFQKKVYRVNFIIFCISSFFAILVVEIFFQYYLFNFNKNHKINSIKYNATRIKNFDLRSKEEVLNHLSLDNEKVYIYMSPKILGLEEEKFIPLSTISDSLMISCNELGYYQIFKTDKYGFVNNNENYKKIIDSILIGDSFGLSECVNNKNSIIFNINKSNLNSISLSQSNTGPLFQFAILKEYGLGLNPKNIFWFYYEGNDFTDLNNEIKWPILFKYFEDNNFRQNLKNNQLKINQSILSNYSKYKNPEKEFYLSIKNLIKLYNIRNLLNWDRTIYNEIPNIYKKIILKTHEITKAKGINLFIIYLPEFYRYKYFERINHDAHKGKKKLLDFLDENKINYIDLNEDLFKNDKASIKYFANDKYNSHYNEEGYFEISKILIKQTSK